jgi:hypothetical protein
VPGARRTHIFCRYVDDAAIVRLRMRHPRPLSVHRGAVSKMVAALIRE